MIARLRELLEGDPAFVACYALPEDPGVRFRGESSFALVVRRSCAEGSWELLDALDADPVLRRTRVAFVVAWAGSPPERMDPPWYARGRLLERLSPWSNNASHMDNAVFETQAEDSLDLRALRPLTLELALSRRVVSAAWLPDRECGLAVEAEDAGLRDLLARLRRVGVERVVVAAPHAQHGSARAPSGYHVPHDTETDPAHEPHRTRRVSI